MNKLKIFVAVLLVILVGESATIIILYNQVNLQRGAPREFVYDKMVSFSVPYGKFNQPISNDTEYKFNTTYAGSWKMSIQSQLLPPGNNAAGSEAQFALAPEYRSENLSIPTIIVQMRGDGLLRIEYFSQNWNNTYGLVLYNSTSPSWIGANKVTLQYVNYGPPSPVNPQLAPRPNGNLTITVGNTVVLTDFPIAWASLSSLYIYGLRGSAFTGGSVIITVANIDVKS